MNRVVTPPPDESDLVIERLTAWRQELLETLRRIDAGEVQVGASEPPLTRQQLLRCIEIYDSTIMRLATREA